MCAPPRPSFEWAQHPGGGNADLCVRPAGSGSEDNCSAGQPVNPAQLSRPPAEAVRRIFQFVEIRPRPTELHLASAAGRGSTSGSRVTIDATGQLALGPTGWKPIVRTAAEPLVVLGLRPKPYDEFSNLSKSATGQRNCTLHRLLVAVAHQAVA